MKKTIIILILVGLVAGELVTYHLNTDGAGKADSNFMVIARWPMYDYFSTTTSALTVTILFPEQSDTYYGNWGITLDLNATVSEGTPPYTCYYRLNGAAWNEYDCESQGVSVPEGAVTIEVTATDANSIEGEDDVGFEVVIYRGGKYGFLNNVVWFVFIIIAFIIFVDSPITTRRGEGEDRGQHARR